MRFVHLPLVSILVVVGTGCGGSRTLEGRDAGCASCHGSPPGGSHPQPVGTSWAAANCSPCHASSVGPNGELLATHADGNTNVSPPPGHTAAFLDANGTIDAANRKLHGALANQRIDLCTACHGADFGDASFGQSCNGCHTALGFADWKTNCTFCHGTRTASWSPAELALAAPPQDVSGSSDTMLPTVGAHQAHVANAQIACTVCHPSPLPVDVLSAGHIDGAQATVQFSGLAVSGGLVPEWNLGNASTCATVYCHGGGFAPGAGGGSHTTPTWTDVGSGQGDCGGCHALPPPAAAHPQPWATLTFAATDCGLCHAASVGAGGALLSGHLDGTTAAAPDCTTCHTPPAQFHTRVSAQAPSPYACTDCHVGFAPGTHVAAFPAATLTCATCHGDVAALPAPTAASPRAAAPPADRFGNASSVVVGAHAAHLDGGTYSSVIACGACHPGVASYGNRHADGTAQVSFASGPGKTGTFAAGAAGVAGNCSSTWCHGNFPGGLNATPSWEGSITCTSCHPLVPGTGLHSAHVSTAANGGLIGSGYDCGSCHPGVTATRDGGGFVTGVSLNPATAKPSHVNGIKTVTLTTGTWSASTSNCSSVGCHVDPGTPVSWY